MRRYLSEFVKLAQPDVTGVFSNNRFVSKAGVGGKTTMPWKTRHKTKLIKTISLTHEQRLHPKDDTGPGALGNSVRSRIANGAVAF